PQGTRTRRAARACRGRRRARGHSTQRLRPVAVPQRLAPGRRAGSATGSTGAGCCSLRHLAQPLFAGHAALVAELAAGPGVGDGDLLADQAYGGAREGWVAGEREPGPERFGGGAGDAREGGWDAAHAV